MKSSSIGARALMFVALSGAAVPACQHYDAGEGKPDRDLARVQDTAPTGVGAAPPFAVGPPPGEGLGALRRGQGRPRLPAYHASEPFA